MDEKGNSKCGGDSSKDQSENKVEVRKEETCDPQMGGKKLKLNDGSSQDSLKELAAENKDKDDNVDSGVSADKSESTSSNDRGAKSDPTQEGPSNVVINAAPSSSNIHAIILNMRRPKRERNYRKRRTPDKDTDSNDSSQDSDDLSHDEEVLNPPRNSESEEAQPETFTGFYPSITNSEVSLTESNSSYNSQMSDPYDSDSTELHLDADDLADLEEDDEPEGTVTPSVLKKARPKHNWNALREIINREMGFTHPLGKTTREDLLFERRFYGSLHAVYRLKRLHKLNKHRGCVNSINFHPEGHLLASGSDDTNVIVWDWARNIALQTIKTGHKSNVFQSKFMYLNTGNQLNIVTCARDGQVRLLTCPGSGGSAARRKLATHARAAHKLHVSAAEPHVVLSAGEDGVIMRADVRADTAHRAVNVQYMGQSVPLYSVHGHPLDSQRLVVAGRDKFVREYDMRHPTTPQATYCPFILNNPADSQKKKLKISMMHLTCAIYNYNGTEILASYNDDDIYLFDTCTDVFDKNAPKAGYTHCYSGHRNSATFKGVAFFGPRSQYVVSGSDCANIYIWERSSEAVVQFMHGDTGGVVNCIEAHPRCPVLASSGLDKDVKIWMPILQEDPDYKGLEKTVKENSTPAMRSPLFNDFLPSLYSAWQNERLQSDAAQNPPRPRRERNRNRNEDVEGNICTTF